jgi:DNA-binding response OmpR family regulator
MNHDLKPQVKPREKRAMLCERCKEGLKHPAINEAVFDRERQAVIVGHERRMIAGVKWQILGLLWAHRGMTVSHERVHQRIWGHLLNPPDDNNLKVHVYWLRQALKGTPYGIATVRGEGYRLEAASSVFIQQKRRPRHHELMMAAE